MVALRAAGTVVTSAAVIPGSQPTMTLTKPTGTVAGDVMLLFAGNTAPSKWNKPIGWEVVDNNTVGDCGSTVFYRFATASEPTSYALTYSTNNGSYFPYWGQIISYSGVAAVSGASSLALGTAAAGSGTPPPLPNTPLSADWVIAFYNYGADAQGTGKTTTYPVASGWTQRTKSTVTTSSTYNGGMMIIEKQGTYTAVPAQATSGAVGMWGKMLICLTSTTPALPSPRRNMCPNPSLAVDATGWTSSGTVITLSRVASAAGNSRPWCYRATINSAPGASANANAIQPPAIAINPGEIWSYSAEVRHSSPTGKTMVAWLDFIDSGGVNILQPNLSTKFIANTTPQVLRFIGTAAPTGAAFMRADIGATNYESALNDYFEVSAVMYERIYLAQPYFDGGSAGWTWDGSAGSSTSHEGAPSGPPPGNWFLPMMGFHDVDPELPCTLITPKQRLLIPGRAPRRRRRVLDLAASRPARVRVRP